MPKGYQNIAWCRFCSNINVSSHVFNRSTNLNLVTLNYYHSFRSEENEKRFGSATVVRLRTICLVFKCFRMLNILSYFVTYSWIVASVTKSKIDACKI